MNNYKMINVPQGATHTCKGNYYRKTDDSPNWYLFGNTSGDWVLTSLTNEYLEEMAKPIAPQVAVPPAGGEPKIQRWSANWHMEEFYKSPHGNHVTYRDHRAHVARLLTEIERLSPPAGQVPYQQQMEAWKAASNQDLMARGSLMIQVEELDAENEALRKDAERYQWLRERDLETVYLGGVFAGLTPDNLILNGKELDAAIDAAMGEQVASS
ncbi:MULTISPECIES: hypothetical protein [Pseudomonas]|uniref:hypothetical protein n=1 Tax=Pseudomonas TaxID=286 RepID=UPI000B35F6CB|nr:MULTISPECIES: hypothetical protein [Pseudomonas]PMY63158.1 hypothetical protein C1Y31_20625 [Pseudomonas sp. FW305-25]PMY65992.1 hypothetical protein C1Y32_21810 [Pseudomonas sp. FW126-L8]PNA71423.1 hypothetical protein C1Y33_29270 [Pseudomonas sp. FW305-76]